MIVLIICFILVATIGVRGLYLSPSLERLLYVEETETVDTSTETENIVHTPDETPTIEDLDFTDLATGSISEETTKEVGLKESKTQTEEDILAALDKIYGAGGN